MSSETRETVVSEPADRNDAGKAAGPASAACTGPAAALRRLPAVDQLLQTPAVVEAARGLPRPLVTDVVRDAVEEARRHIRAGAVAPAPEALARLAARHVQALRRRLLTPVINATGVVLHTNLGRAPLSAASLAAMQAVASGYSNLEYEVETGRRGSRHVHGEALLTRLTGAEAAMVVNNNAAAVLLVLSAVATGREVILSRGEMIEIGGAFRIPEVMAQSGCLLREVGTTNRTHRRDYEQAIGDNTAAILKVHPSNYRVMGFTASVSTRELAELAHRRGLLLIEDLGSGVLVPTERYGVAHEPTVQETLAAGADLVTFSGDKLLGGPQAGIIVGRRDLVEKCRRHPLARAVRVDKLTLAALQATLQHYLDGTVDEIPVYRMLARSAEELTGRADAVRKRVLARLQPSQAAAAADDGGASDTGLTAGTANAAGTAAVTTDAPVDVTGEITIGVKVVPTTSTVGGGSLPGEGQPSAAVAVTVCSRGRGGAAGTASRVNVSPGTVENLAALLRRRQPPIVGRIEDDVLLLDLRTVDPSQDEQLAEGLAQALAELTQGPI